MSATSAPRSRGILLIVASAALFGTTGTAQALGLPGADPAAVGLARLVVGGAGLALLAILDIPRREPAGRPRPGVRTVTGPVVVGALAVVGYQLSFFAGVRASGVALGTVVTIGSAPVFAGVLGRVALGERPGSRWVAATTVAIAGLVLVARPGAGVPLGGLALNLAAGLSYAVFAIASKGLVASRGPVHAMALVFGGGGVLALPMLAIRDLAFLGTPAGAGSVVWLGLAATTLAYLLYGAGLTTTPVAVASTFILFEPVVATVLGVLVVGERPDALAWAGTALIGGALLALGRSPATGQRSTA